MFRADSAPKEGGGSVRSGGVEMKKERMKVLAVDHALRRETARASRLAEELQKISISRDNPHPILSPGCVYKVILHISRVSVFHT